ncbi:hypothetical protein CRG98_041026 [Punica granatum]|uniref:Uncharacterized protein n=1 Tax=Punica granatum TaxID=22663 RepID=A0A2I0I426_PUNGR|nr:hypothetical protein CRG98_041026 [Punica granatum]
MAMKSSSVELFLAGEEENDFGFELLPLEPEDLALSQWELVDPSDADSNSSRSDPDTDLGSSSPVNHPLPIPFRVTAGRAFFLDDNGQWVDRAGNPAPVVEQIMLTAVECTAAQARFRGGVVPDDDYEDEDGEDDDDDDDDGLDDELESQQSNGVLVLELEMEILMVVTGR